MSSQAIPTEQQGTSLAVVHGYPVEVQERRGLAPPWQGKTQKPPALNLTAAITARPPTSLGVDGHTAFARLVTSTRWPARPSRRHGPAPGDCAQAPADRRRVWRPADANNPSGCSPLPISVGNVCNTSRCRKQLQEMGLRGARDSDLRPLMNKA